MRAEWKARLVGDLSWKRAATSFLFVYAALAGYAQFLTDGQIFLPNPSSYRQTPDLLSLRSGDERISALYLPSPKARYTLLFSHGNAEDLGDVRPVLRELHDQGFAVFAYDYRGYGTSTGKPSEPGAYADVRAAYGYLTETLKVPPTQVIIYGRSVGSGPSVELASTAPVAGLVLENPFMSAFRVRTVVPLLPFDKFNNVTKMERVKCPVLVMHGRGDEVIPFYHGEGVFAAAKEPRRSWWVDRAGHNEIADFEPVQYRKVLKEFEALVASR